MSAQATVSADGKTGSEAVFVDVSRLVGYEIKMYTEQLPGKQLCCKVVSALGQKITVDSGGAFGVIGNLVSPQKVILQFPYKGQDIAVRAQLKRSCGGRASLNKILPTVVFIFPPSERSEGSRTTISAPSSIIPSS